MENAVILCKNCGHELSGKYCGQCGEKTYGSHDKSVTYIFEEAFHFITHFEGNFFTSVRAIFRKPGKLSHDYCNGIRKRYYKPVSMFFFVIVIYLLFPRIFPQGLNMEMKYHAGQYPYRSYSARLIEAKMQQKHLTIEELSAKYHEVSHNVSKFMLFVLLPFSALLLFILFPKRGIFYDHFMLGTEINVFFLVYVFMIMPLVISIVMAVIVQLGHVHFYDYSFDFVSSVIGLLSMAVFCFIAFKRFYGVSTAGAVTRSIVFTPLHYILVFIVYKFFLFIAVMWML